MQRYTYTGPGGGGPAETELRPYLAERWSPSLGEARTKLGSVGTGRIGGPGNKSVTDSQLTCIVEIQFRQLVGGPTKNKRTGCPKSRYLRSEASDGIKNGAEVARWERHVGGERTGCGGRQGRGKNLGFGVGGSVVTSFIKVWGRSSEAAHF